MLVRRRVVELQGVSRNIEHRVSTRTSASPALCWKGILSRDERAYPLERGNDPRRRRPRTQPWPSRRGREWSRLRGTTPPMRRSASWVRVARPAEYKVVAQ